MTTRNAVDFIAAAKDEPFFMFVGYYNPHSPYKWAERHDGQFKGSAVLKAEPYRNPSFMEEDLSDKPQYLQDLNSISVEKIDITYRQILRSLLSVDDGVASMLSALEKTGLSEKTVIVYLTDNGTTVGDHGFGESRRTVHMRPVFVCRLSSMPLLFSRHTFNSRFAANIDLAPTFADLAGIPYPDSVNGESLLPLLRDRNEYRLAH